MKTKKEEFPTWSAYKRYTAQIKEQALELADRDGIPKVAQDLGGQRRHCVRSGQSVGKQGNPLKTKSSNKLSWLALKETTPAWKRKWLF